MIRKCNRLKPRFDVLAFLSRPYVTQKTFLAFRARPEFIRHKNQAQHSQRWGRQLGSRSPDKEQAHRPDPCLAASAGSRGRYARRRATRRTLVETHPVSTGRAHMDARKLLSISKKLLTRRFHLRAGTVRRVRPSLETLEPMILPNAVIASGAG